MNHEDRKTLREMSRTFTFDLDTSKDAFDMKMPETFCLIYPGENGAPPKAVWTRNTNMRTEPAAEGEESDKLTFDCKVIPAPHPTFALRRAGLYLTRMEHDLLEGFVIDFGGEEHGIIPFSTRTKAMEAAAFISGRVDGEIEIVQCEDLK